MALRAGAAGALAFLASLLVELLVLGLVGAEGELALAVALAPAAEEVAKRLAMLWCGAAWGLTGLAFGVIEGGLKLAEWHGTGVSGAIASVLQHWAYGRFAERARRGLALAFGLHLVFNTLVILADLAFGEAALWFAPVAAALLLLASIDKKRLDRDVDAGPAVP